MEIQKITLGRDRAQTVLHAVQGEANAQTFAFTLLDSHNTPVQLADGMSAAFYVNKFGNTPVQIEAAVDVPNQTVNVTLPLQATTMAGNHTCLLQLYSDTADVWRGDVVLSVVPNPASQIPSLPEFQVLTKLMLGAEGTLLALSSNAVTLQALAQKFLIGIEPESSIDFSPEANFQINAAATDGARWYMAKPITDRIYYSDDLKTFLVKPLSKFGNVDAIAANETQVCVIGPQYVQILESGGGVAKEIPTALRPQNMFMALRRYGPGFLAIPDYGDVTDVLYIEYTAGQWKIESAGGPGGRARDIVMCGDKLAWAYTRHRADGTVTSGSVAVCNSLSDSYTSMTMPGNRIPVKLGWDGMGLHMICEDGSTYYSTDLETFQPTGEITAPEYTANHLGDIVCTGGYCGAVLKGTGTAVYAGPGEGWTAIAISPEANYGAAAAANGKFLFAGDKHQAVYGLAASGSNYAEKLAALCRRYETKIRELESSAGQRIILTAEDPGIGAAADPKTIVFVYEEG